MPDEVKYLGATKCEPVDTQLGYRDKLTLAERLLAFLHTHGGVALIATLVGVGAGVCYGPEITMTEIERLEKVGFLTRVRTSNPQPVVFKITAEGLAHLYSGEVLKQ